MKPAFAALAVQLGFLVFVSDAGAYTFSPAVGVAMQYTDNATFASANEQDDWIAEGFLSATLVEDKGPLQTVIDASLVNERYLNDSFGDQTDFNLGATATWEQIAGRLVWQIDDYFTQTSVDSLGANSPANVQDTNVFSISPTLTIPVSGRNVFTLSPLFRDFQYEKTDTDNRRLGLRAGWRYLLSPAMNVGLDAEAVWVDYDVEVTNPNYQSNSLQAVLNGAGGRAEYQIRVGATQIDRDQLKDASGATAGMSVLYKLTPRTALDARFTTEITDISEGFFSTSSDPNSGSFTTLQVSGDVLRNNTLRVSLNRDNPGGDASVWLEYNDLDYETINNDRKAQEIGIDYSDPVNSMLSARIYAVYGRIEDEGQSRTDKRRLVGGSLSYRVSRSLTADFDIRYQDEDSTSPANSFDEFRGVIGFVYGFGKSSSIPRSGRASRY